MDAQEYVDEMLRRIALLKEQNGSCTNRECELPAMVILHWPVQPGEPFSRYCPHCAAWMERVATTMGFQLGKEELPGLPQEPSARRIRL